MSSMSPELRTAGIRLAASIKALFVARDSGDAAAITSASDALNAVREEYRLALKADVEARQVRLAGLNLSGPFFDRR